MLNMCLLSGSLEFWYMVGKECLCDQPPIKTLSAECLMSFISLVLSQPVA